MSDSQDHSERPARNTFSPVAEAALARLESLTLDLARKAARLPSNGELIDNEPLDLARVTYWPEPAVVITEAYLDEDKDALAELPEQHDVLAYLRERFADTMVKHVRRPRAENDPEWDDYDDEFDGGAEDVLDRADFTAELNRYGDDEGGLGPDGEPLTHVQSLDEEPPEDEEPR